MDCSKTESHLHILRGILHCHERMMDGRCPVIGKHKCETAEKLDGKCANNAYLEALREAIRCVEFVHVDIPREMEGALANKEMRKEAESKGKKFSKNYHRYSELAFPFLFGHFISTILFTLIQLLLYLF